MLDFQLKLRPFGNTYWVISPVDYRLHQCFLSLNSELQYRLNTGTILSGEALIDCALKRDWIIISLIKETSGFGSVKGNYKALVQVANGFKNKSILVNKCVGLLKILEHNAQKNGHLPIKLEIYHFKYVNNKLKEKRIIEEDFVSSSAFLHLGISHHFNF